jgi:hypothetical protein
VASDPRRDRQKLALKAAQAKSCDACQLLNSLRHWLARWLIARGVEAHVIHSASVAVSRERKRAKTDRLDAAMLMRIPGLVAQ